MSNKVALLILDGFGITPELTGNSILNVKTPNLDALLPIFPKCLLKASAEEVGLPWGEFGSSEVGHTSIGLGRIVLQDLPQITEILTTGRYKQKPEYKKLIASVDQGSILHFLAIMSDGAVHGHINHLIGLVKIIKAERPKAQIVLHLITDGRDTAEKSALLFFDLLKKQIGKMARFGSLMGRYYAMDRDKNWDRIQAAYQAILGEGKKAQDPLSAINDAYTAGQSDEFIEPVSFGEKGFDFTKDVMIFTNYRADRALQITRAFVDPNLTEIKRRAITKNFYAMTTYDDNLGLNVLFSNLDLNNPSANPLTNPLVQILSERKLTQFHIAETEKFAHITYFFAGGEKKPYQGEVDKVIPTKKVKSFDLYPQMRALEIAQEIIDASKKGFDFIAANLANGDMVGHTGNFEASKKAVVILDHIVGKVVGQLLKNGYVVYVTADHGNCDEMIDFATGKPNKEHTLNPVPFIYCDMKYKGRYISKHDFFNSEPVGILADIAPTICHSLGIEKSAEMSGINLLGGLR